jgi:co-chaperonin GroES (HSP10)
MSYVIKPQGDRLLIKMDAVKERVVDGVFLPAAVTARQDALQRGTVVTAGAACVNQWAADMRVLIAKDGGIPVKHEDVEYVLIPEGDILAVEEEDDGLCAGIPEGVTVEDPNGVTTEITI